MDRLSPPPITKSTHFYSNTRGQPHIRMAAIRGLRQPEFEHQELLHRSADLRIEDEMLKSEPLYAAGETERRK